MVVAPSVVDITVNPSNNLQYYVLWNNGRIDAYGGAPAITSVPDTMSAWYTRFEPPGVAIYCVNWTTGALWVLDYRGGFNACNGATHANVSNGVMSGIPITSAPNVKQFVDWAWDTTGNGQGYVLDNMGKLWPFGGASTPTVTGNRYTRPVARKLDMSFSPNKRAVIMDMYGGLKTDFGATLTGGQGTIHTGWDASRDLVCTAYTPVAGYKLNLYGGIDAVNISQPTGAPQRVGADVGRALYLMSASNPLKFRSAWANGSINEWVASTPPTVKAGAGENEIQQITVTGAPTAGTWSYTVNGQTATALSRTITASALQTALEGLSSVGTGNVSVTGGPAGTAALVVTFQNAKGNQDITSSVAHTFTGGTSPAVNLTITQEGEAGSPSATVTTTTRPTLSWDYNDAQGDQQKLARVLVFTQTFVNAHSMTDPTVWASSALADITVRDRDQRGVQADYDYPNASYRFYVQVTDTADQVSAWSNFGWTQNVPAPATPTGLTATVDPTANKWRVTLSVSATTGGSANLIKFQWSTDGGATWYDVRGAGAVPLTATTTAADEDPPIGKAVTYSALAYATNPRVISARSNTDVETLLPRRHVLTTTADNTLGGEIIVNEAPSWSREVVAGVFWPVGDPYAVVVTDGIPKSLQFSLAIGLNSDTEWAAFETLIETNARKGGMLVFRDPFGDVVYCKPVGTWGRAQKRRLPVGTEPYPLGHKHQTQLQLVEVKPPYLIPVSTSVAP